MMRGLFYWMFEKNFGDQLSVLLCRRLCGRPISYASPARCGMVAVGSLLENFLVSSSENLSWVRLVKSRMRSRAIVWGTGFISAGTSERDKFIRRFDVRALRGKLSLERLRRAGCRIPGNLVLGDPGLLAPILFDGRIVKRFRLGIVPHFVERDDYSFLQERYPHAHIVDVRQDPLECIREIAMCEVIASSSLHGMVVADAFGIPNVRLKASDRIVGGDFKFNDYLSALEDSRLTIDVRADALDRLEERAREAYSCDAGKVERIVENLLRTFPDE